MSLPSAKKRKHKSIEESESHSPTKKQREESTEAQNESHNSDPATLVADEDVFTLECPARKGRKKGKIRAGEDDVFGPTEEDGGFPELKITYEIRPGKVWTDLNIYRFFSIEGEKFSLGSLVYINKRTPPPEPPDPNASEAEMLEFHLENDWVGRVLEVRAASSAEVWLRIFWLYWPKELPRGRQKYHGNQELVMSNHMAIIDAKTVASSADIKRWDEYDEDQDVGRRFWRQFFDVQMEKTKSGGLSTLRRHCVCNEYYNPDDTMLKCPSSNCGIWNHQECLEEETKTKRQRFPASRLAQLKSDQDVKSKTKPGHKPHSLATNFQSVKSSLMEQSTRLKDLLMAEVTTEDKGADGTSVIINSDEETQDPEVRTVGFQGLKCGTPID